MKDLGIVTKIEILIYAPFPTTARHSMNQGETRLQAVERLKRMYCEELHAVTFFDIRTIEDESGMRYHSDPHNTQTFKIQ